MRKLIFALPLLLLGCDDDRDVRNAPSNAQRILRISTIACADGNQVRMAVYGLGTSTAFTGWTILNDDGTPKKCIRRDKAIQPQYEEVPQ